MTRNTGFWARRFSTCKEFMPASSIIFVVLVAHFESTCWKDVSLKVSTDRRPSLPLSLSIFYDIWCGVPEGCSKETKCMCTCCPWCFCRVLPSDTRLSPVCPHRTSRRTLEPLNQSPGWTIDVAAGCRARLQRQNRESDFCRYGGIGGTAVSRAGGGERWLRACQWSSFKWKKQLGLQQEVWVSTASRRLLRKHLHVKSSHSVKRHVTLLAFFWMLV